VVILSMVINDYSFNGYYFNVILLIVISSYFINGY
jgi:hypothetical protein